MRLRSLLFSKAVSLFIIAFFSFEQIIFAAPFIAAPVTTPVVTSSSIQAIIHEPSKLHIPVEHVSLKEFHQGTNGKLIIHIQDAHANYSGQMSLASALSEMVEEYDIPLVLVEGSARDVSLNPLKKLGSEKDWRVLAKKLLLKNVIAGEEYLNLTSDVPIKLKGVEYEVLYNESLKAYAKLVGHRKTTLNYLHRIQIALERVKNRLYPKTLLSFEAANKESNDFFGKYFERLIDLAEVASVDFNTNYDEIQKLIHLRQEESKLDLKKIGREQNALLQVIKQKGGKEEVLTFAESAKKALKSPTSQAMLIQQLFYVAKQYQISLENYADLTNYKRYLDAFQALNMDVLLKEAQLVEDASYKVLLPEEPQRKLRIIDRFIALLEKAYRIQMSSDDFKALLLNQNDFETKGWQGFINQQLLTFEYLEELIEYKDYFEKAAGDIFDFYRFVDYRDEAFLENTGRILEEEKAQAAFLVAGGYHTQNLTALLRESGYSYCVLTPYVASETDHQAYEKMLLLGLKESPEAVGADEKRVAQSGAENIGYTQRWVGFAGTTEPGLHRLGAVFGGNELVLGRMTARELSRRVTELAGMRMTNERIVSARMGGRGSRLLKKLILAGMFTAVLLGMPKNPEFNDGLGDQPVFYDSRQFPAGVRSAEYIPPVVDSPKSKDFNLGDPGKIVLDIPADEKPIDDSELYDSRQFPAGVRSAEYISPEYVPGSDSPKSKDFNLGDPNKIVLDIPAEVKGRDGSLQKQERDDNKSIREPRLNEAQPPVRKRDVAFIPLDYVPEVNSPTSEVRTPHRIEPDFVAGNPEFEDFLIGEPDKVEQRDLSRVKIIDDLNPLHNGGEISGRLDHIFDHSDAMLKNQDKSDVHGRDLVKRSLGEEVRLALQTMSFELANFQLRRDMSLSLEEDRALRDTMVNLHENSLEGVREDLRTMQIRVFDFDDTELEDLKNREHKRVSFWTHEEYEAQMQVADKCVRIAQKLNEKIEAKDTEGAIQLIDSFLDSMQGFMQNEQALTQGEQAETIDYRSFMTRHFKDELILIKSLLEMSSGSSFQRDQNIIETGFTTAKIFSKRVECRALMFKLAHAPSKSEVLDSGIIKKIQDAMKFINMNLTAKPVMIGPIAFQYKQPDADFFERCLRELNFKDQLRIIAPVLEDELQKLLDSSNSKALTAKEVQNAIFRIKARIQELPEINKLLANNGGAGLDGIDSLENELDKGNAIPYFLSVLEGMQQRLEVLEKQGNVRMTTLHDLYDVRSLISQGRTYDLGIADGVYSVALVDGDRLSDLQHMGPTTIPTIRQFMHSEQALIFDQSILNVGMEKAQWNDTILMKMLNALETANPNGTATYELMIPRSIARVLGEHHFEGWVSSKNLGYRMYIGIYDGVEPKFSIDGAQPIAIVDEALGDNAANVVILRNQAVLAANAKTLQSAIVAGVFIKSIEFDAIDALHNSPQFENFMDSIFKNPIPLSTFKNMHSFPGEGNRGILINIVQKHSVKLPRLDQLMNSFPQLARATSTSA